MNTNYEKALEIILDTLKQQGILTDIDWGTLDDHEIINLIIENKIYSFESYDGFNKNITISFDTMEEEED